MKKRALGVRGGDTQRRRCAERVDVIIDRHGTATRDRNGDPAIGTEADVMGTGQEPLAQILDEIERLGVEHRDPVDRIIIATARRLNLQIVTADREILRYGKRGYVNVIDW